MLYSTVYINWMGRAPIGFTAAMGELGYFYYSFKNQANQPYTNIKNMHPQMVMRPFTRSGAVGYDIDIYDEDGAAGLAKVPASVLNDDYHIELYTRDAAGAPQVMFAYGRLSMDGYGYRNTGPLGPATFQTGPSGPAGPVGATGAEGPKGDPGIRGSRWYTTSGPPSASVPGGDRVVGDMCLDELTGDVYRWNGTAWTAFKGV
jgi:hypothetical protein